MASFGQQLVLTIAGPLVTVILGTLIIGGIIQFLGDWWFVPDSSVTG